jgi:hypothetical protein
MNNTLWLYCCKFAFIIGLASIARAGDHALPVNADSGSDSSISSQISAPEDQEKAHIQRVKMTQDQKEALKARRDEMRKAREIMLEKHREDRKTDKQKRNPEFQEPRNLPNQDREQEREQNREQKKMERAVDK